MKLLLRMQAGSIFRLKLYTADRLADVEYLDAPLRSLLGNVAAWRSDMSECAVH